MQPPRFAAGLTPVPTAGRVTRQRSALRWRVISTVISAVLLIAVILLLGRDWPLGLTLTICGLWVLTSAFWLTVSALGLRNAKRDLASIPDGVSFYLDANGVEFVFPEECSIRWAELKVFKLVGRNFGAGQQVLAESLTGDSVQVPLSFLDATAAVIDSAAQAYSLGRVRLDVTALDNVF